MQDLLLDNSFEENNKQTKCSKRIKALLIDPSNLKLKRFHLIVSFALYVDFFMSSFIMGNYRFQVGTADPDFLNHRNIFLLLIII
jgi:hypothetical protein